MQHEIAVIAALMWNDDDVGLAAVDVDDDFKVAFGRVFLRRKFDVAGVLRLVGAGGVCRTSNVRGFTN